MQKDIEAVVQAAKPWPVKVILETRSSRTKRRSSPARWPALRAASSRLSTGFAQGGATAEDVAPHAPGGGGGRGAQGVGRGALD